MEYTKSKDLTPFAHFPYFALASLAPNPMAFFFFAGSFISARMASKMIF